MPRGDGTYGEYYCIDGIDPDRLLAYADAHDGSEARFLSREADGGLLELIVSADCPAVSMAELGALPRDVAADAGVCRIEVQVPPAHDETAVTAGFFEAYGDAQLVAKRETDAVTPVFSRRQFDRSVRDRLTDRQREVLELARRRGYYEWPRRVTQQELAAELDIAAATLTQHLRAAERRLIELAFETDGLEGKRP